MSQKHSEQYRIIGQAIQKYRKQKGFTQEQLAEQASISISYLTKIEAPGCDQPFSLEVLLDIREALDVSIHKLLEDIE
ncbi:MAG: helix-turn-helix transcriptional regulator [Lachnospiraceae bacterium]|nr:helix-turn-helix transcriptional regulator [Lachnospiraceae bacterium]